MDPWMISCKWKCKAVKRELLLIIHMEAILELSHLLALFTKQGNQQRLNNAQEFLHFTFIIRRKTSYTKLIRNLAFIWNGTREFLLCHSCSGIFMSTGNRGSQDYDKGRSQRVGVQGYIGRGLLFGWFSIDCMQPCIFTDICVVLEKPRIVMNFFGGDLDVGKHIIYSKSIPHLD